MANLQQAPELRAKGEKIRSKNYWSYDPELISWIMVETGSSYSQLKLMLYLMGNCAGKWQCSTEDVLNKTGITSKQSLSTVKKALKKRGWIDYEEGKHITVLYDNMYELMRKGQSENDPSNNKNEGSITDLPIGSITDLPKGQLQIDPMGQSGIYHNNISNNIKDNIKENNIRENDSEDGKQEAKIIGEIERGMVALLPQENVEWVRKDMVRLSNVPKPGYYRVKE